MESKSHCLGLFHPTEFLFLTFFSLSSHIPPKCTVGMWHAIKSICKRSSVEQKPYDVLLIPTLSFDYSTIILYLCKLERKGRLNNLIIYDTVAAQKPQDVFCMVLKTRGCLFFICSHFPSQHNFTKPSTSSLLPK